MTIYLLYLISAVLFILSLKGLSHAKTAWRGNLLGIAGMILAILTTFLCLGHFQKNTIYYSVIIFSMLFGGGIGFLITKRIAMMALPQLIAAFHSLVGLSAVLISITACIHPKLFNISFFKTANLLEMVLGAIIGAITFTGSIVAFLKLQGIIKKSFKHNNLINIILCASLFVSLCAFIYTHHLPHDYPDSSAGLSFLFFFLVVFISSVLGVTLSLPVGGADMPVLVSLLNSYSGWAAAGIGFTMNQHLLIITGALVGSSGAILSYIMCKGMNRSLLQVIMGGNIGDALANPIEKVPFKTSSPSDCSFMMQQASQIIIVPGYGMAASHAQHSLKEISEKLKKEGIMVRYAIHPVAGRMPGHMNVLLAEAGISYDDVLELEDINHDFSRTDVVLVIGANDITNPAARTDTSSPLYGMPILNVDQAKVVFFIKRSLGSGYSGVDNALFYKENTFMVLGDGKKVCENIFKAME